MKKLFKSKLANLPKQELANRVHRALEECGHKVAFEDVLMAIDVSSQPERGELALKTSIFSKKYGLTGEVIVSCLHRKWTNLLDFIQVMNADLPYVNFSLRYDWIPGSYLDFEPVLKAEAAVALGTVVVEWAKSEGDTGPYLLYSYARAQAVMRKASSEGFSPATTFDNLYFFEHLSIEQKQVIYSIMAMKEQMEKAASSLKPGQLCAHVFRCCQAFNAQYAKHKVLTPDQKQETIEAMLLLYSLFCQFLELAFDIFGWEPLEEL